MSLTAPVLAVLMVAVGAAAFFAIRWWLDRRGAESLPDDRKALQPAAEKATSTPRRTVTVELGETSFRLAERLATAVEALKETLSELDRTRIAVPTEPESAQSADNPATPSLETMEGHLDQIRLVLSEGFRTVAEATREAAVTLPITSREPAEPPAPINQDEQELEEVGRPPPSDREARVIRKINDWIEDARDPDFSALEQAAGYPLHAVEPVSGVIRIGARAIERPDSDLLAWLEPDGSMRIIIGRRIVKDYTYKVETPPTLPWPLNEAFRKDTATGRRKLVSCGYALPAADPHSGRYALQDPGVLSPL